MYEEGPIWKDNLMPIYIEFKDWSKWFVKENLPMSSELKLMNH